MAGAGDLASRLAQLAQPLLSAGALRDRQLAISAAELLLVEQQRQLPGSVCRPAFAALPRPSRQAEGAAAGDTVAGHRRNLHRRQLLREQQQQSSASGGATKAGAHRLRAGAQRLEARGRRGAACDCVQNMAMARPEWRQRHQTDTHLPQRKRPHLHLLQSGTLESHVQYR